MTGRFAAPVEAVLRRAGWHQGRKLPPERLADMHRAVASRTGRFGGRLTGTPLVDAVLTEFGGLTVASDLAGIDLQPLAVTLDPATAVEQVETLIDLGRAAGTGVYPLGIAGPDEAPLALTELGSVLAVDSIGDWRLGGTIEEALDLLVTGRQARPLTTGDGHPSTWLDALAHSAAAAFFLPRTPLNLHYVWLPDVLVRIGVEPTAGADHPGRFEIPDWGGFRCQVHALDLESHTVLVIAFEPGAAAQRAEHRVPISLAQAFRDACAGLSPELAAAFVTLRPADNLSRLIADREHHVANRAGQALLDQEFDLLYLADRYD